MVVLPPDLSRLGDELTAAAARTVAERRRRRRRIARAMSSAAAGILTVVTLAPAALSPDSVTASLAPQDSVLVRLPDRRPLPFVAQPRRHTGGLVASPPARRPVLPAIQYERDA
jgi:hypothetical protein